MLQEIFPSSRCRPRPPFWAFILHNLFLLINYVKPIVRVSSIVIERDIVNDLRTKEDFWVGQEGEFLLYDSFHHPIGTVHGKIIQLMDGKDSLYALIETKRGVRPGRLRRSVI